MTLLEKLQAHRGGLVRLPTPLYWYGRGGWDSTPGRLCLLLDTADGAFPSAAAFDAATGVTVAAQRTACVHLLIDGQPRWVRVSEGDVELL